MTSNVKAKAYEASRRHYNRDHSSGRTWWTSRRINGAKRRIGKVLTDRFGKVDGDTDDLAASQMPCNPKGEKPHFKQYLAHPRKGGESGKTPRQRYGRSHRSMGHAIVRMSTKDALASLGPLLASLSHLAIYKIRTLKAFDTKTWHQAITINMAVDPSHYEKVMALRRKHPITTTMEGLALYPVRLEFFGNKRKNVQGQPCGVLGCWWPDNSLQKGVHR